MTAAAGTLILARRDITELMSPADWLEAVESGFRAAAEGRASAPPPMHVEGKGGAFHAKGASLKWSPEKSTPVFRPGSTPDQNHRESLHVALKLNGNFPSNPSALGLPTIQGALLLCDGENGSLLAIMDSIEITLRRTAAATALAARYLARPQSATVLVCGCGEQGVAQLAALRHVLPLTRVLAWDRDPARAEAFARTVQGLDAAVASGLAEAARESDVIVTCTTAREPFLAADMVAPGTFVAAVGADSPDKSEIRPDLMARARVVADVLDQCVAMGDLRHAIAAGAIRREAVHAELAELVSGARPGRASGDEVTLFDSTGTALQDVAAAVRIYECALTEPARLRVDLAA